MFLNLFLFEMILIIILNKKNKTPTGKRFFNNGESPNGAETRAKIC